MRSLAWRCRPTQLDGEVAAFREGLRARCGAPTRARRSSSTHGSWRPIAARLAEPERRHAGLRARRERCVRFRWLRSTTASATCSSGLRWPWRRASRSSIRERLAPDEERFLLAGLSAAASSRGERFEPLPKVGEEIAAIQSLYGGDVLLDAASRPRASGAQLVEREPTVVHVASHAYFRAIPRRASCWPTTVRSRSTSSAAVVAPRKYTEAPLELLVLSACETASGDEQAALGLAGVAMRSGARSAVGSLWPIPDEAAYQRHDGLLRAR